MYLNYHYLVHDNLSLNFDCLNKVFYELIFPCLFMLFLHRFHILTIKRKRNPVHLKKMKSMLKYILILLSLMNHVFLLTENQRQILQTKHKTPFTLYQRGEHQYYQEFKSYTLQHVALVCLVRIFFMSSPYNYYPFDPK